MAETRGRGGECDRIHVSWGPEGDKLSPAEKQEIVDRLLADSDVRHEQHEKARKALDGLPYVAVPVEQLAAIYERMLRLTGLGQATIDEWNSLPKQVADLKHKIFAQSDFGAVYAGQWLPKDVRNAVRDKLRTEALARASGTTRGG